jgi:hypothetical protein
VFWIGSVAAAFFIGRDIAGRGPASGP